MEQDKNNAEKKVVSLEAKIKELENEKTDLVKSLKISEAANVKKDAQIAEVIAVLASYRKLRNSLYCILPVNCH